MREGLEESFGGMGAPSGTSMSNFDVFGCNFSDEFSVEKYLGDFSDADPLNVSLFAILLFTCSEPKSYLSSLLPSHN